MRFDSSLPQAKAAPFREAVKRSPDKTVNALLPLALAVGAGIVSFFGVGLIALGLRLPVSVPLFCAGLVMLVAMCGFFFWMMKKEILWTYEEITHRDVTGDGVVGPPVKTLFELPTGPRTMRLGEVDIDPVLLIEWCQSAVQGGSLSFEAWIPRFCLPDGSKGRERYTAFREWLIRQGYARKIGGPVGLCVNWRNPEAVAFVAGFAETTAGEGTPLLEGGAGGANKHAAHRLAHTGTLEGEE